MGQLRKPDGEKVETTEDYAKAWHEPADAFCNAFGVELLGFDPGFTFLAPESEEAFKIPAAVLLRIVESIKG